jgi:predicted restriction endonuclease
MRRRKRSFPAYKRRKSSLVRMRSSSEYKQFLKSKGLLRCFVCGWSDPTIPPYFLLEVHHITRVEHGGTNTPDNYILLCPIHHRIADYLSKKNKELCKTKQVMISLIKEHEFNRNQQSQQHTIR